MLQACGLTDPGCVRGNNEDYFLIVEPVQLYLVADGMGGAQAGEHASKLAAETVAEFVAAARGHNGDTLLEAITEANRRVLQEASAHAHLHGMGTTMTACLRQDGELVFANVGDSRAYMYDGEELHTITDDQTWVNEVGRKLHIAEQALKTHPMRHVLTMAIGVSDSIRINSYRIPLKDGAVFLLCSDGLHGVVAPARIEEILRDGGSLADQCNSLIEAAKTLGAPDNVTAVLLRAE